MELTLMRQLPLRCLQSTQSSIGTRYADTGSSIQKSGYSCLPFSRIGCGEKALLVWTFRRVSSTHESGRFSCRSSGGSRRDDAKIVARTQRRRSRHVKGVTPTKPELFDKLEAEEEADADLDRFQASADSEVGTDTSDELEESDEESSFNGSEDGDLPEDVDSGVEIEENGDDTYTVKYFPDGRGRPEAAGKAAQNTVDDLSTTAGDTAEDISSTLEDASQESQKNLSEGGSKVQDNVEDAAEGVGEAAGDVSNVAQDTVGDVSGIAQDAATDVSKTVQSSAQDLTDIAREGGDRTTKRRRKKATTTGSNPRGVEEVVPTGDSTYSVKYYPEGEPASAGQAAESATEDGVEVAGKVADVAEDTVEELSTTAQGAADETGKRLNEAADTIQEDFQEGTQQVQSAAEEIGEIARGTSEDVAQTARGVTGEVGELVDRARAGGQEAVAEGADAVSKRLREGQKEAEENLVVLRSQADEAGERATTAFDKVSDEAAKSLQSVQDSLSPLADNSAKAAATLRAESVRLGEVILNAAGEAFGLQGKSEEQASSKGISTQQSVEEKPKFEAVRSENGSKTPSTRGTREIDSGAKYKSSQPEGIKEEDKNLYKGLKVTVAGASGRTGRLLVEELASKGVSVTALVRDKKNSETRAWANLSGVEVVEADLYKYESIKKSLGDSNVVISAIGARSFPFDPIGTYQAEFEGVKNLVAAAKNKGDVKKFVFITSLGVTYLQIVPLIFWKKQSELYLQRSGLDYTIVRPGGLTSGSNANEVVRMKPADTQFGGSISRRKVAEVCVAAIVTPEASEKIVEIVSGSGPSRSYTDLFGSV